MTNHRQSEDRFARRMLAIYVGGVCIFLIVPILLPMVISFSSSARIEFPPPGFSLQWYEAALSNEHFRRGLLNSLIIAFACALLSTIAGTAAAIALNHYKFIGRTSAQLVLMMPLALPAVVKGLGIMFVLPSYGLSQGVLATVFAHCVLGIPYVAYLVLATLANYDLTLEQASRNLGASGLRTFIKVTFPLIKPGVVAGGVFAFLMSLDNVSLSLFTAAGDTLPLRLMQHIQHNADPTIAAVSTFLIVAALVIMALFGQVIRQRQLSGLKPAK
ncbi:ABC transporter permease [Pseudochelatococcus sp. G4_1912]|uniref:ABC transporter permease n=1 Tax=Pseudochelatococcus sp. G4_1912 TaxID=3114288 RepID=UPI0039C6F662